MGAVRWVVPAALLAASFQAAAYDAARCAETRTNIAKLQANLSHGPTASDRAAFEQALTVYRKVEPVFCGSGGGSAPGANAKPAAALDGLAGTLRSLDAVLSQPDEAWRPAPAGPALPAPPVPTGSVSGPMTMQRLGGGGPASTTAASSVPPGTRALEAPTASSFPTDQQIGVRCATATNPSMCELALQNERNQDPAYQRWKAAESARLDRNIDAAIGNVDAAVAASRQPDARVVIPVAPPPMPYDNSDPDLAKCREGEKAPWTIAGCYDLAVGRPAAKTPEPGALRERLRRALAGEDDDEPAQPSHDEAGEAKWRAEWKQRAEARLLQSMQQGRPAVPENTAAREACEGAWLYDGFGPGTCSPWNSKVVYAVDVPTLPPHPPTAAGAPPAKDEPFRMNADQTRKEVDRLTRKPDEDAGK